MKKIMLVLITLLAVCLAVSAVSAESWSFSSSSDSNGAQLDYDNGDLNIQGIDFKIPDGYKEQTDEQALGEKVSGFDGCLITSDTFTKGDDELLVKVIFKEDGSDIDPDSYTPEDTAVNKTIKDKAGFFDENDDGTVSFVYFEDGQIVEIDAPDEKTVSDVIIK